MDTRSFWKGFTKQADVGTASGFTGTGKGNLPTGYSEQGCLSGTSGGVGEDTRADKTLLDRQRNPKDYAPARYGQDDPAESNPHIIY